MQLPLDQTEWSRPDNRFIPMRACDLVEVLASDAARFAQGEQAVREFAAVLQEVIDRETGAFERHLSDVYARFNPDRETLPLAGAKPPTDAEYSHLTEQLAYLLDKANYEQLDDVQIAQAVMRARSRNLNVRVQPDRVEFLDLWVRGRGVATKLERPLTRPWRARQYEVPVFKRMVVIARLKGEPHVLLKVFKDIPEADAEALLPHAEVTMSLWDRLQLLGTSAGTLGITASKVLKIAVGFAALWKLAWILLIGLVTFGVRAIVGYRNARINRNWQRTQHLYFQNLGNNASALQLLVATVKQEEFKEVLLAYLFGLAPSESSKQATPADLRQAIECYLQERIGVDIDFDISDAMSKLQRLGLVATDDREAAPGIEEATLRLKGLSQGQTTTPGILECG